LQTPALTLGDALREATQSLAAVSPTPRLDAETLAMHVCGATRAALITRSSESLDTEQYDRLRRLVAHRRAGEPLAYLTGTREFWSLALNVTPAVLIPRPETELLVECALARIPRDADSAVADLGTGSGAIALAIAHERPHCRVIATDTSPAALAVARDNAHHLGIGNVEFRLGDWLAPLGGKQFDIIVSNPPYVRADDPHLQEGDPRFEPKAALVGGLDGLDAIRHIAADARARLRSGGWILLEHGYDQADVVAKILADAGFCDIECHRDLAGNARVIEAR
jgi:release factor glutamine methyltransferase